MSVQRKIYRNRLLGLGFLLGLGMVGCRQEQPLVEPRGERLPLLATEMCESYPEAYKEYAGWNSKALGHYLGGEDEKALFCFNQAQATFPLERPEFGPGSPLNLREWSGQPVRTYLAKAEIFIDREDWVLAEHYLDLSQTCFEHPSDVAIYAEMKGKYHFARGEYREAKVALKDEPTFFCRVLLAATRFQLNEAGAALDLHYLARELRARVDAALNLMADRLPEKAAKSFLKYADMPRGEIR